MKPLSFEPIAVVFRGSGLGFEEEDGGEGVTFDWEPEMRAGGEEALTSPSSSSSTSSFSLSLSGVGVAGPLPLFALGRFFFGVELGELPLLPTLLALLFNPLRLLPRHTPTDIRAITATRIAANTDTFSSMT